MAYMESTRVFQVSIWSARAFDYTQCPGTAQMSWPVAAAKARPTEELHSGAPPKKGMFIGLQHRKWQLWLAYTLVMARNQVNEVGTTS